MSYSERNPLNGLKVALLVREPPRVSWTLVEIDSEGARFVYGVFSESCSVKMEVATTELEMILRAPPPPNVARRGLRERFCDFLPQLLSYNNAH